MVIDYVTQTGIYTRVGVLTYDEAEPNEERAVAFAMEHMSADEYAWVDRMDDDFEVVFENDYLP